jgi:molybdenum cofactor cytidylyltransferase
VQIIINNKFEDGMYSSIKAGVATLDDSTEAFFILPGDCAFSDSGTITILADAYRYNLDVIYPVHGGRRGHPALVSSRLCPLILSSNPEGGLKALLEGSAVRFIELPVPDPGINYDMDTIKDYQNISGTGVRFPSELECIEILMNAGVNEQILLHSKKVARTAIRISEYLNSRGCRINTGLVMAAGLLHDIAKEQPGHDRIGSEIIGALGYKEVSDIIALHMDISAEAVDSLDEAAIIYLADKLVQGSRIISLEKRFSASVAKYEHDVVITGNIKNRFNNAFLIKKQIENMTGLPLEDILQE